MKEPRAKYGLKIFFVALAISALYNWHSIMNAAASLYAPQADHSPVAPGNYVWTPEKGLKPLTADSPRPQPNH